ncbi:hypothetical protein CHARACLAT_033060, partial [Characodon lateralis]|nr:hypothetical protein [Characodon lateralis]
LDSEFGRLTGEKAELFFRKWEANIIPKLKAVAALEPRLCPLLKGIEDMTEGIYVKPGIRELCK